MITQISKRISNQRILNRWLIMQMVISLVIITVSLPWARTRLRVLSIVMMVYMLTILGGLLTKQRLLRMIAMNSYIQCFVLPIGFSLAWYSLCKLIFMFVSMGVASILVGILALTYLGIYLPVSFKYAGQIKGTGIRAILLIVWLVEMVLADFTHGVHVSYFFKAVVQTGFLGAIAFAIMVIITMRQWRVSGPKLRPFWTVNTRWLTMFVVMILIPMLLILGTHHWNLAIYRHSHWLLFLTAWKAGIAEELTFRFGVFSMIYKVLDQVKLRLLLAIFLTSLIFGYSHLLNLLQQPLSTTLSQVIGAVFIGVVFQILYLYTGQLWLAVVTHFFFDWTGFLAAHGTSETWSTSLEIIYTQLFVFSLFIIFLLLWTQFGKRHLVMKEHADYLLNTY